MEKLIREAGSWAERLGLEPEVVECHGWKESAGTVLVLSHDPALDRLLRTRFPRVRGKEQTDLFLDTAPARAVMKLADALAAGDASGAREGLADLDRLDPPPPGRQCAYADRRTRAAPAHRHGRGA